MSAMRRANPPLTSVFVSPEEVRINGQRVYVSEDSLGIEPLGHGVLGITLTLLSDDFQIASTAELIHDRNRKGEEDDTRPLSCGETGDRGSR